LTAFRILFRNRMRAGLTMLGIIIGVGAVIAMVSIGQGAKAVVQAQVASMGTNVIIVLPGAPGRWRAGSRGERRDLDRVGCAGAEETRPAPERHGLVQAGCDADRLRE